MRERDEMENAMDVVITVHMPTGDGQDYALMAVVTAVDALTQAGAIAAAVELAEEYGFEGELAGIRLAIDDKPDLLPGEELVEGGIEALAEIRRGRDQASSPTRG